MPPAVLIWIIGEIVKLEPQIREEIALLLKKSDPTVEDWNRLKAMASRSYESYARVSPPSIGS